MNDNAFAHSVRKAAERIGYGRSTVYEEINAGRLKARKLQGRTIILDEDIIDYLRSLPEREAAAR